MNLRKTAALLLSLIMCFSLIVPVGSFAEGTVTAADNAKRSEDLLAFAGRLHNMTEKYSAEYTKKAADTDPYANGRIIVKSAEELDYTGSVAHVNGYNDWHIIQYRTSEEARKAAEAFELVKGVQYAEPDIVMQADQEPGVNEFLSWGYGADYVDAFNYNEWMLDYAGGVENLPEVVVAVIDTGYDSDHPYLVGRSVPGYDFVNNDSNPEDDHGHGSHCAGTIIDGNLPNVKIMPLKVLDAEGYGNSAEIILAMEYASLNGAAAANLSLSGPCDTDHNAYVEVVAEGMAHNDIVYCVAAGNNYGSDASTRCPANVPDCVTVAAHDRNKLMADFSNVGEIVDITAPGVGIRSVRMGGGYTEMDGTSMATPHVAAACALLKTFNPDMGAFEVINTLKGAAIDVGIEGGGTGILNVTDLLKFDNIINGEGSFLHFTSASEYPWNADANCAFSGNAGVNNSTSVLSAKATLGSYQRISFEYKVSSEQNHDYLRFLANGEELFSASGSQNWQTYTCYIPTHGDVLLTWEFSKDASGAAGDDKAYIRNVVLEETLSSVINTGNGNFLFEGNNYPWTVDGNAAKSGNAGVNNSTSEISTSANINSGLTFRFNYKFDGGAGDKFQFVVDGNVVLEVSTASDWTQYDYLIEESGDHTFAFRYVKDGSGAAGSDCAWVKEVNLLYTLESALNVPGGELNFTSTGSYPWAVLDDYAKSSNEGVNSSTSAISLSLTMSAGETLTFRYKVSSEQNYDKFIFTANNTQVFSKSGSLAWEEYTYTAATSGTYNFEWKYTKDGSVNRNDDCAYLDDVEYHSNAIPGDSDGDGTVTVSDALLAMRYAMGTVTNINVNAADIDGDGNVTITDAVTILRMAMTA